MTFIESFFDNEDNEQFQSWWSTITGTDFDFNDQQDSDYNDHHHDDNVQQDETEPSSDPFNHLNKEKEDVLPPPDFFIGSQCDLMNILDERPLEDLANQLFGVDGLHFQEEEFLPTFVYFTTDEKINNNDMMTRASHISSISNGDCNSSMSSNNNNVQEMVPDNNNNNTNKNDYDKITVLDNHGEKWNYHFQHLQDYHSEFGHFIVPYNYKPNPTLAQWVKRQRHQYKLKTIAKHSTLTTDRETALIKLGFVWSAQDAMWEERFQALEEYKKVNGHCNVPSTYKENSKLSIWVKSQRRQCKLFKKNDPCFITENRFLKLKSLGFNWNPRNT